MFSWLKICMPCFARKQRVAMLICMAIIWSVSDMGTNTYGREGAQ